MLWIATVAALATDAPAAEEQVAPRHQALAVVRIVSAARITLGQAVDRPDAQGTVRATRITERDGSRRPAILIEFS
jgi:hypothetical protein